LSRFKHTSTAIDCPVRFLKDNRNKLKILPALKQSQGRL